MLTNEGKAQVKREGLDKVFRLSASVHITNMVAFDANGKIKKYNTPEEIISDFYDIRFTYYMKRKVSACMWKCRAIVDHIVTTGPFGEYAHFGL